MNYNREVIYSTIEKYFSIEKEGLRKIKDALENPQIDDAYMTLGLDSEHRKRWSLTEHSEIVDDGWKVFKACFRTFVNKYKLSYEDFKDNRVIIDKNQFKLKKALVKLYTEEPETIESDYKISNSNLNFVSKIFHRNIERKHCERTSEFFNSIDHFGENLDNIRTDYLLLKRKSIDKFTRSVSEEEFAEKWEKVFEKFYRDAYEMIIEQLVKNLLDNVGKFKLPATDKLELVLSCNYEDWFFCSTGNSWSSCLNLESGYPYWSGLPGMFLDSNRAMLYITDGEKKRPISYIDRKVEVDKVIARSWVLLKEGGDKVLVKFYPSDFINKDDIASITGIKFKSSSGGRCKNEEELIFHTNGYSLSVFKDNTAFTRVRRNDDKNIVGRSSFGERGNQYVEKSTLNIRGRDILNGFSSGLRTLYDTDATLKKYFTTSSTTCSHCGRTIHGDPHYAPGDDNMLCSVCFENFYFCCEDCDTVLPRDEMILTAHGREICDSCFSMLYYRCSICRNVHSKEGTNYNKLPNTDGEHACRSCVVMRDLKFTCSGCGTEDDVIKQIFLREDVNEERPLCKLCFQKFLESFYNVVITASQTA